VKEFLKSANISQTYEWYEWHVFMAYGVT